MRTGSTDKRRTQAEVTTAGIRVYHQPNFLVQRDTNRKFFCKDQAGRLIAEFVGMGNLTEYVSAQSGKSKNYIKQQVYKNLNKNVEFLGYRWSDK